MDTPPPPPELPPPRDRREVARATVGVALLVVVIVFAVVNLNTVKVDWIVGSGHAPLIIVIAITLLVGLAMGSLGERFRGRRR